MPPEGFTDLVTSDETGFHLNIPVSNLIKRVTRAIEASDVASTPLVAKTADGVIVTKRATHDRISAMRGGSWKAGLGIRPNARS